MGDLFIGSVCFSVFVFYFSGSVVLSVVRSGTYCVRYPGVFFLSDILLPRVLGVVEYSDCSGVLYSFYVSLSIFS